MEENSPAAICGHETWCEGSKMEQGKTKEGKLSIEIFFSRYFPGE
jgi:hypothetical protein